MVGLSPTPTTMDRKHSTCNENADDTIQKEAKVDIGMLYRFFKMNACNSLTNHDTDVVMAS